MPKLPHEQVGAGYFLTAPDKRIERPSNHAGELAKPKVTADFDQPVITNTWWASLIWQYDENQTNPYSNNMYPHPLTLRAQAQGLEIGYPTTPDIEKRHYMFWHQPDLVVGLEGLKTQDTRVAGYSDWTVTAEWKSGGNRLRATFGHGLPFVYFETSGSGKALLRAGEKSGSKIEVWSNEGERLGITVAGHHYGVFAPSESTWETSATELSSDLAGKQFFSVAVLPDRSEKTLSLFSEHAYAFVTDTRATWKYDQAKAELTTHFEVVTELKEPGENRKNEPLQALYRHQWLNSDAPLMEAGYQSPRGEMKLLAANSFDTRMRFNGVLPILPDVGDYDRDDLEFYVKEVYWADELFPSGPGATPQRDAYWIGKSLGKLASVAQIADQIGYESAQSHLLQAMKNELQDWFDGNAPSRFYYDKTWNTLIGDPAGFGSGKQLNDHHFHYGYLAFAAAIVARYDQAWAERWAPFVNLLIKDAANWERKDKRFPFLRYMDVYAGHSWANGPSLFNEGNNEESSSEDINFSTACILWGSLTNNPAVRDLGIFLYTNQVAAVEQYWFDVDRKVFPKGFDHPTVAMVWGAGGRYDTWWDQNPIYVHGINFLPFNGGSLYLGRHPEYVSRNYGVLRERNRGEILIWRDWIWMFLGLSEPEKAIQLFEENPHFEAEFGNSRAMVLHWLHNLKQLGHLDTSVTANTPTYAVFKKGSGRTHVAFNPTTKPVTVTFSDGVKLTVKPHELSVEGAAARGGAE